MSGDDLPTRMALAQRACEDAIDAMFAALRRDHPGLDPALIRDHRGTFVLADLLAANAQLLAAMAYLEVDNRRRADETASAEATEQVDQARREFEARHRQARTDREWP